MKKSYSLMMWGCFISLRMSTSSRRAASSSSDSFLRLTHLTANEMSRFDRWYPSRTVEKAPVPSCQRTQQITYGETLRNVGKSHRMAPPQNTVLLFQQALTTPFNRYSSSNRFPLLELGIGAITPVVLTRVVAVVDDAMVLIQ